MHVHVHVHVHMLYVQNCITEKICVCVKTNILIKIDICTTTLYFNERNCTNMCTFEQYKTYLGIIGLYCDGVFDDHYHIFMNVFVDNNMLVDNVKMTLQEQSVRHHIIGCYYRDIEGNYELMKNELSKSINLGNGNASNSLGWYYKNIVGDVEQAVKYFLLAIGKDCHIQSRASLLHLGIYYKKVMKNNNMAVYFCKMAIDKGYVPAMKIIAMWYEKNMDDERTIFNYRLAISEGCVKSMYKLGCYYGNVLKNYEQSVHYYKMAVQLGCEKSMNNLGLYYENVIKDCKQAVYYYKMRIPKRQFVRNE